MLITAYTVAKNQQLTWTSGKVILIAFIATPVLLSFVLVSLFVKKKHSKRCEVRDCKSLNYITSKSLSVDLLKIMVTHSLHL